MLVVHADVLHLDGVAHLPTYPVVEVVDVTHLVRVLKQVPVHAHVLELVLAPPVHVLVLIIVVVIVVIVVLVVVTLVGSLALDLVVINVLFVVLGEPIPAPPALVLVVQFRGWQTYWRWLHNRRLSICIGCTA